MNLDKAFQQLAGIRIVICDDEHELPNRYLEPKDWHGGCWLPHAGNYSHRVQKKWNKRFGMRKVKAIPDGEVVFHRDGSKALMNSVTWQRLQERLT